MYRCQVQFEEDFINTRPVHAEYMRKLQQWRDRYETLLDQRPRWQSLELLSHYLTEFEYNKVDEIEVPGQYTEVFIHFLVLILYAYSCIGKGRKPKFRSDTEICAKG